MKNNLRDLIPSLQNKYYFNYGGQGPLPEPSLNEILTSWRIIQELGPFTNNIWPFLTKEIYKTKQLISTKMGVNIKNIALSENISTGLILPLWGIQAEKGDELLISDCEHPGIVAASIEFCRRNDLRLIIFPIQKIKILNENSIITEIGKYLNKNTKIIIISHVLWNYGFEVPLIKLRNEIDRLKNIPFLLVDGAQSFGHIDINNIVKHTDLYSITSHKWACGPEGLGAFYISDKFINNSNPTIIGWKSLKREQGIYELSNNLFQDDARKFEIATSCTPLLSGLRKSLELLNNNFPESRKIELITSMSNYLWSALKGINAIDLVLDYPLSNGIVSFDIKKIKNKDEFIKRLGEKNIWIRVIEDPKWFRVCIHQMTTFEEINILLDQIKFIIRG